MVARPSRPASSTGNISNLKSTGGGAFLNGCDINSPNSATNRDNYNNTLIAWAARTRKTPNTISFGNTKYTGTNPTVTAARAAIVATPWTLSDGGGT